MDQLIWVVCLDRSGSMGEGFSATTFKTEKLRGQIEETKQKIKLDAAKEAILREVEGLDPSSNIAILAFNDTTDQIYSGNAGDINRIKEVLAAVEPGGQTNIAGCLLKCCEFASKFQHVDCLIVTDGLSNVGDPIAAARECNKRGIFINVALIDPTSDGEKIAREIAQDARVYFITSATELDRDVALEGIRHQLKKERQDRIALQRSIEEMASEFSEFRTSSSKMREQIGLLAQSSKDFYGKISELKSDVGPLLQSFSLGIPIDQAPLNRYVPVRVYLKEGSEDSIERISWGVDRVLENISFFVTDDFPTEKGSWWKKWAAKSKEVLTYPEVQKILKKVQQAIESQFLRGPTAKIDKDLAGATAALIKAVEKEPEAVLQVGSILVLKIKGGDGKSKLMVRTLSPNQLAIIERSPEFLKEPAGVFEFTWFQSCG